MHLVSSAVVLELVVLPLVPNLVLLAHATLQVDVPVITFLAPLAYDHVGLSHLVVGRIQFVRSEPKLIDRAELHRLELVMGLLLALEVDLIGLLLGRLVLLAWLGGRPLAVR